MKITTKERWVRPPVFPASQKAERARKAAERIALIPPSYGGEVRTDHCTLCSHCVVLKRGRKKKQPHPCVPVALHESESSTPGRAFKLLALLRAAMPIELWKTFKPEGRPKGYRKETHFKPARGDLPSTRISRTPDLLRSIGKAIRPFLTLRSESPLKVLHAYHGPDVLLHPQRPEAFRSGITQFEREELKTLQMKRQTKMLAAQEGFCVGGIMNRLSMLQSLKVIEPSEELKEFEPLRAMSLQEITNISLLKDAGLSEESDLSDLSDLSEESDLSDLSEESDDD